MKQSQNQFNWCRRSNTQKIKYNESRKKTTGRQICITCILWSYSISTKTLCKLCNYANVDHFHFRCESLKIIVFLWNDQDQLHIHITNMWFHDKIILCDGKIIDTDNAIANIKEIFLLIIQIILFSIDLERSFFWNIFSVII